MKFTRIMGVLVITLLLAAAASAEPTLQLYIEGAQYDDTTETWVVAGGTSFNLWAIGNLSDGPNKLGIYDVKLAVAYESGANTTISLTPTTTGNFGGFTDPSTPTTPVYLKTVTDGSLPKLGDGSDIPSHGVYGVGTDWSEYRLGDFTVADSPCGDFIDSLPAPGNTGCQINAYTVTITGGNSSWIHFDLYDHIFTRSSAKHFKYVKAPFSHDGEYQSVPEPGTVLLLGSGLLGLSFNLRRRWI